MRVIKSPIVNPKREICIRAARRKGETGSPRDSAQTSRRTHHKASSKVLGSRDEALGFGLPFRVLSSGDENSRRNGFGIEGCRSAGCEVLPGKLGRDSQSFTRINGTLCEAWR